MIIKNEFPQGILRPELYMGIVDTINANYVNVIFSDAGAPSGAHYVGSRYGKGEVGELVIIEGQVNLVLGRVVEVKSENEFQKRQVSDGIGRIQLLGTISMDSLKVSPGIDSYPRLRDRVYAAPHKLIAMIPSLMISDGNESPIEIQLGSIGLSSESKVSIRPEKLFGRHLAILGSTGGGKSWTTAKIIGESIKSNSKLILLDATGEYRSLKGDNIKHFHLGNPIIVVEDSIPCVFPPSDFQESDFIALFEPSGKVQGPKLKEAIKSLRLVSLFPEKFPQGYIEKIGQSKKIYRECMNSKGVLAKVDNPSQSFDVTKLINQINQECHYPGENNNSWGRASNEFTYCLSLVTRIGGIINSPSMSCVFSQGDSLLDKLQEVLNDDSTKVNLIRLDLSGVSFEYKTREIISNAIGRYFLNKARENNFINKPCVIFIDEAHNFIGQYIGTEDTYAKLDSFELIAKEGRKFGLNICLATQRPRDITEGVLSQVGTMIVHRLTNDRDREIVERASSEIDRSAASFLPNLKPGEAVVIGNDFPIPLIIQIDKPETPPLSSGPDYQKAWKKI